MHVLKSNQKTYLTYFWENFWQERINIIYKVTNKLTNKTFQQQQWQ